MGLDFFKLFRAQKEKGKVEMVDVTCRELFEAAQEYQIRELCFWICVDMIANAMGRCEIKTFQGNEEVFEKEYYMWNYSPNINQNSTMFMHKLIAQLYQDNEALIVNALPVDGRETLVVADDWEDPEEWPSRQNEYRRIVVDNYQYQYPIYENNVIHLKLNHKNMRPVVNGLYQSYFRLVQAAIKNYEWDQGQHWKVHVSQMARGDEGWAKNFQAMIEAQVKPFLNSNGAILPEFDGYEYEKASGTSGAKDTRDIKNLIEDIFDFTARAFLIPAVLVNGKVEGTADANTRFLTNCIDPICDQLQEEATRKRYGYDGWHRGDFIRVDSSSIIHFDLFENAANVEKLVGSGAYTINDVRRAANQATINEPWADEHYMTLNISTMGQATRPLTQEGGEVE